MFHQFKITPYAFILCLFGLTLMTVSPVFAEDSEGKRAKKNCFRDLARSLQAVADVAIAAAQPSATDECKIRLT